MYLLDTTHCLQFILGFPGISDKRSSLGDVSLATSVIVRGELLFGAHKSGRLLESLAKVESFFRDMIVYHIDERTADLYGELKNTIISQLGPKDKGKRRNFRVESLGFKDNDLWIAATAIQRGLILVSADSHIQRLQGISRLQVESW